jgi:hypothetical protein
MLAGAVSVQKGLGRNDLAAFGLHLQELKERSVAASDQ